jgi:hypothetical protein
MVRVDKSTDSQLRDAGFESPARTESHTYPYKWSIRGIHMKIAKHRNMAAINNRIPRPNSKCDF